MHRLPGTGSATVGVRTFAYTFVPPLLVMAGVVLAKAILDVPVEHLTTEATTIARVPPYFGLVRAGVLRVGRGRRHVPHGRLPPV